jgi:hypothetical protein
MVLEEAPSGRQFFLCPTRPAPNFWPDFFLFMASGCCRYQSITKFFGPGHQASDTLLLVSFFEGLCTFV